MSRELRVGWREWATLPDLDVGHVKAKVDTGAKTSAIHAYDISIEGDRVRFLVHPIQDDDEHVIEATAPLVEVREIKSSNGETEQRPVVSTTLRIGDHEVEIELTLTDRDEMGFRMLLGREALRAARCVVDPARSFLLGGTKRRPA